jgi:hypothetical protein
MATLDSLLYKKLASSIKSLTTEKIQFKELRTFQLVGVVIYIALVILGIHGSSMGLVGSQGSRIILGNEQGIRSDEYLRSTPTILGQQSNRDLNGQTELSEKIVTKPLSVHSLVNLEKRALSLLPSDNYFSAMWWLPFLLVWIFLSQLLRLLEVPSTFAIFATLLVISSPGVVWWSFHLLDIIGRYSFALCLILLAPNVPKNSLASWIRAAIAASTLGSLIYLYQPWVVCVGIVMYLPLLLTRLTTQAQKKLKIKATFLFIVIFLLNFLQNLELYQKQVEKFQLL